MRKLVFLAGMALAARIVAGDRGVASLAGISTIDVVVDGSADFLAANRMAVGRITTQAEIALRERGILVSEDAAVELILSVLAVDGAMSETACISQILEHGAIGPMRALTWCKTTLLAGYPVDEGMAAATKDLLLMFVNDYLTANPPKPGH